MTVGGVERLRLGEARAAVVGAATVSRVGIGADAGVLALVGANAAAKGEPLLFDGAADVIITGGLGRSLAAVAGEGGVEGSPGGRVGGGAAVDALGAAVAVAVAVEGRDGGLGTLNPSASTPIVD